MKLRCVRMSTGLSVGSIYEGVPFSSAQATGVSVEVGIIVFNDDRRWMSYPASFFEPAL